MGAADRDAEGSKGKRIMSAATPGAQRRPIKKAPGSASTRQTLRVYIALCYRRRTKDWPGFAARFLSLAAASLAICGRLSPFHCDGAEISPGARAQCERQIEA